MGSTTPDYAREAGNFKGTCTGPTRDVEALLITAQYDVISFIARVFSNVFTRATLYASAIYAVSRVRLAVCPSQVRVLLKG